MTHRYQVKTGDVVMNFRASNVGVTPAIHRMRLTSLASQCGFSMGDAKFFTPYIPLPLVYIIHIKHEWLYLFRLLKKRKNTAARN